MIKVRVGGEHGVPHPPTQDVAGFLPFYGMTSTTSSLEYIPRNGRHNQFWYPCSPEYTPRNGRYNQLWYPGTQEYLPGYDRKKQFWYPGSPEYPPGYDQHNQFWYQGTPEYLAGYDRHNQFWYPGTPACMYILLATRLDVLHYGIVTVLYCTALYFHPNVWRFDRRSAMM